MKISVILITLMYSSNVRSCSFEGLLSSCHMTVGGIGLQASAQINHCRNPIDITFQLRSSDKYNAKNELIGNSINWKYTYVTSNQPESLEIPGSGRRILLNIMAGSTHSISPKSGLSAKIRVHALFLVDGQTTRSLSFLDELVRIPHFDDCAYKNEEDQVGNIAMGCIIAIIILCLTGVVILFAYHKYLKRKPDDEEGLVPNMERTNQNSNSINAYDNSQIHYVVPNREDRPGDTQESHELQVYVSTSEGLQKVERKSNSPSTSTHSKESSNSNEALDGGRIRKGSVNDKCSGDETVTSSVSNSSNADRSLGAIPKTRSSNSQGINSDPSSKNSTPVKTDYKPDSSQCNHTTTDSIASSSSASSSIVSR